MPNDPVAITVEGQDVQPLVNDGQIASWVAELPGEDLGSGSIVINKEDFQNILTLRDGVYLPLSVASKGDLDKGEYVVKLKVTYSSST